MTYVINGKHITVDDDLIRRADKIYYTVDIDEVRRLIFDDADEIIYRNGVPYETIEASEEKAFSKSDKELSDIVNNSIRKFLDFGEET